MPFLDNFKLPDGTEAILLDKDGTIIDVHHYWIGMSKYRIDGLIQELDLIGDNAERTKKVLMRIFGIDPINHKISKDGPTGVKTRGYMVCLIEETLRELNLELSEQKINTLFNEVDISSKKEIKSLLKLLPGIENFVRNAHQAGIDLNLLSNDLTSRSELALETLGLYDKFRYIYGQDAVDNAKPHRDLACLVIKEGSYEINGLVNIGDHPNDMRMGLNAGIKNNYAVLTGLSALGDFKDVTCNCFQDFNNITV